MLWDTIFHQYDIRGIYPTELNEECFYIIGRALSQYLKVSEIAVGHDMRLSSESLFKALTSGITDQGTSVVDLGLISTEMNYFASGKYGYGANVIISASHNPGQYNGLKIVKKGVIPLHGDFGLPEIKKLAQINKFTPPVQKGMMEKKDILKDWVLHAISFVDPAKIKPLKLVIDAGNGMGGISWNKLKDLLPLEIIPMYFEPDGHFPNHLPDPLKEENILELQKKIINSKADLGMAIDGDADRLFILDEKGHRVSGTITTAILAKYLLEKYGPSPILFNAVCGKIVPEVIKNHGGKPIRVRVGHSFIKETMKKENALFAGEHSGHFYFRQNYFADSSTIAGLILLEYLSVRGKSMSGLAAEFDKYKASNEINYHVNDAKEVIIQIEKIYSNAKSIDHIDGLSVFFPDWWFSLRASNTEPMVRLNVEADNNSLLTEKLALVESELKALGGIRK